MTMSNERTRANAEAGDLNALTDWVRAALRGGDRRECLDALDLMLRRWRATPWSGLADCIEAFGAALETRAARDLRSHKKNVPHEAWLHVAQNNDLADLGALLSTLHRGKAEEIADRMRFVETYLPDPRTASTFVAWLLDLPFRATSSRPLWGQALTALEACHDPRALPRLAPVRASGWVWPAGATMASWLETRVPKLLADLEKHASTRQVDATPSDAAVVAGLSALYAVCSGGAGLTLDVPEENVPEVDGDAVLGALLSAAATPLAWQRLVAFVDAQRADKTLSEATLDRIEGALRGRGWPDELRKAPVLWLLDLLKKKPSAHPALRLARMANLAHKKLKPEQRPLLLARPELQHFTLLTFPVKPVDAAFAEALAAHPAALRGVHYCADAELAALADAGALRRMIELWTEKMTSDRLQTEIRAGHLQALQTLRFGSDAAALAAAVTQGQWPELRALHLLTGTTPDVFLTEGSFPALETLEVTDFNADAGAYLQTARQRFPRLRALKISTWKNSGRRAVAALIDAFKDQLEEVSLSFHSADLETLPVLGACPHLQRLELTGFEGTFDAAAAAALLDSASWSGLHHLKLEHSNVDDSGLAALAASPRLKDLQSLGLHHNKFDRVGVLALSKATFTLHELFIGGNNLGVDGLELLMGSNHVPELRRLEIPAAHLNKGSGEALAAAPFRHLERLILGFNGIDRAGAEAMAASPHLQTLHREVVMERDWTLDLTGNPISPSGRAVLERAFGVGAMPPKSK